MMPIPVSAEWKEESLLRRCARLGGGGDDGAVDTASIRGGKYRSQRPITPRNRDRRAEFTRQRNARGVEIDRDNVRTLRSRELRDELTHQSKADHRDTVAERQFRITYGVQRDGTHVQRLSTTHSTADTGYKDQNSSIHLLEALTELSAAFYPVM